MRKKKQRISTLIDILSQHSLVRGGFESKYAIRKQKFNEKFDLATNSDQKQSSRIKFATLRRELKKLKRVPVASRDHDRISIIIAEMKNLR